MSETTTKRSPTWVQTPVREQAFPGPTEWTNPDYPGWILKATGGGYNIYSPPQLILASDTPRAKRYHERLQRDVRMASERTDEVVTELSWVTHRPRFSTAVAFIDEVLDGPAPAPDQEITIADLQANCARVGNMLSTCGFTFGQLAALGTYGENYSAVGETVRTISRSGHKMSWHTWDDLLAQHQIGPRSMLALVNYVRSQGAELPWFAQWDQFSAHWTELRDLERVPAPAA